MGAHQNQNMHYKEGINDLETWCLNNGEWGQQLLDEWDYEENMKHGLFLEPREFCYSSTKKVWWKCKTCGRSWDATIGHRTTGKRGCVNCFDDSHNGKKRNEYDTSHISLFDWCMKQDEYGKKLLDEWDYKKNKKYNINITPHEITYASGKKVWWKCKTCGRSWDAKISSRTHHKSGCVHCFDDSRQGIKTRDKDTSKTSLYDWCKTETDDLKQRILEEYTGYDEEDNYIDIREITRATPRKIRWKCSTCGNIWIASVLSRTNLKSGCPICTSYQSTSYPEQFIYWSLKSIWENTESRVKLFKNIDNRGIEYDIYVPATDKFKGLCIEYSPTFWHKGKQERDAYKRELCEKNKLDFIEIIEDKNNELEHIFKEDYICFRKNYLEQDEQLKAIVRHILKRYGLTDESINYTEIMGKAWNYSHGEIEEEKQLSTLYPELIKEWHPTLNGELKPEKLLAGSVKRIYWQCINCSYGKNGEWVVRIGDRVKYKSGCTKCGYNWYKAQTGLPQKMKPKKEIHTFSISQFV